MLAPPQDISLDIPLGSWFRPLRRETAIFVEKVAVTDPVYQGQCTTKCLPAREGEATGLPAAFFGQLP